MQTHQGELLTVSKACRWLGLCERTVTAAIDAGELPIVKFGKRNYVPRWALEQLTGRNQGIEA